MSIQSLSPQDLEALLMLLIYAVAIGVFIALVVYDFVSFLFSMLITYLRTLCFQTLTSKQKPES